MSEPRAPLIPFPPRPTPMVDTHTALFNQLGLNKQAARLMFARDNGPFKLATIISLIDAEYQRAGNKQWANSPFLGQSDDDRLSSILNILLLMQKDLLRLLIQQKTHEVFDPAKRATFKLVEDNIPLHINLTDRDTERPVIYALVHCSPAGDRLTPREYDLVLDRMSAYINTHHSTAAAWASADQRAWEVDSYSPHAKIPTSRNWSGGAKDNALLAWSEHKGVPIPHPRRYAMNDSQKAQVAVFVNAQRERLARLCVLGPHGSRDHQIPYSMVHIEWSNDEEMSKDCHYKHLGNSSPVTYLLETVSHMLFPNRNVLMHHEAIVPIICPADARPAEHVLSILTGSYAMWGGLNGTLAGNMSMENILLKNMTNKTWENAMAICVAQGVYIANAAAFRRQQERMEFYIRYREVGSELVDAEYARERVVALEEQLQGTLVECKKTFSEFAAAKDAEAEACENLQKSLARYDIISEMYTELGLD